MKNITVILSYTLHNFSSVKLHIWDRLLRLIFVNPLPFKLNIVIKDPFFVTCKDIFEKWGISLPWKKNFRSWYAVFPLFLSKSTRDPNTQLVFQVVTDCGLGYVEVNCLILEYFYTDCIFTVFLKHLDGGLMSIRVWVHLSMRYRQNESLKINFWLGGQ